MEYWPEICYSYQVEDSLWEIFCLKLPKFSFSRGSFKNKTELWFIYDQWQFI